MNLHKIHRDLIEQINAEDVLVTVVEQPIQVGYASIKIHGYKESGKLELRVDPRHVDDATHTITQQLLRGLRFIKMPAEEQKYPGTDMTTYETGMTELSYEIADIANKYSSILPIQQLAELIKELYQGLIIQATSMPLDLRIEKALFDDYPELRDQQKKSLSHQIDQAVLGVGLPTNKFVPSKISKGSTTMNLAFATFINDHIFEVDKSKIETLSSVADVQMAKKLMAFSLDEKNSDAEVVQYWVDQLGINSWFKWVE